MDSRVEERKDTNIFQQRLFVLPPFRCIQSRHLAHDLFRAFLTLSDCVQKSFYSHLYHPFSMYMSIILSLCICPFLVVLVAFCPLLSVLLAAFCSKYQDSVRHILPQSQQKPEHSTRSPIFFCVPFSIC